ncbi:RNA 2',3'-cyclic phosphodiesterase [Natronobiforma cellulositropha]|uniref:RNA 2',3'-cyclic phosphodiesterase n=1 Tax=Natronobiforma cellulositropha TaxID=1679076 RepID=UPI0021D5EE18|nr:RNA 2',3'-cyclic phosphodiesterase [Natronobiforma cellulositropha]
MRLFVSVDLPESLTEAFAALQAEFDAVPGLRVVDPEQAHLTLQFLGEVGPAQVATLERELAAAVDESGVFPFTARFAGLGAFPNRDYIRVLWLGVEDGRDQFSRLHDAIEARTTALGFEADGHEFTPHVTLGRMTHAGGKETLQHLLSTHTPTVGEMRVDEVRLTESTHTADGPRYETRERFSLEAD